MVKEYKIEIEKRELTENLKNLRVNDGIPGVYYSHNSKESVLFTMQLSELRNAIKSGAQIFQVSVGGKLRNVIFKSVQYHPVQETVQHIDLYGVNMDIAINIKVPLILSEDCIGVQEDGGVVNTPITELEISCLPSDIPQSFDIDITDLHLGESIQASSIELDEKLTLITHPDTTIVSITHAALEIEPEVEEEELEEGIEGEEGEEGVEGEESTEKSKDDVSDKKDDADSSSNK